ncbi:helix-turn-helix transcriptional regulator [Streptomyces sp. TLI_171]|uniref:ArsR/SmtB family transcription factor n=1 Tax=Streptomyces sp. TLI_171 TaxID=1938859 RepID=UPI00217EF6EA|nr:winged helix-turn-helix domain-containing protein [Streptomyces sp. TLI_171]
MAFSAGDLAQLRFAVTPMWQVVTGYRLLRGGASCPPVHRPWAEQVGPRLAAAGLDRGWLAELVPPAGFYPKFLNPAPAGPAPTLEQELTALRSSPPELVHRDLDHLEHHRGPLGPRARALRQAPEQALARLAQEIRTYWDVALAPYWARIRAVLDTDVMHRARQVAEHGAGRVLNDLHAAVNWDGDVLHLTRWSKPLARSAAGPGLVLVPSAFTGPRVPTRVAPPDAPQLVYPARGAGTLWAPAPAAGTDALAAVLGRSRTRLLAELDTPASTTQLAHRTGLSPAGVSQYLTALRAAGLVSAHRVGRSVLYARTAAAETLLDAAATARPDDTAGTAVRAPTAVARWRHER